MVISRTFGRYARPPAKSIFGGLRAEFGNIAIGTYKNPPARPANKTYAPRAAA
tara:strand:+ start:538 stop:696 length:159 start_codon:yes stop_codon:yes gene_type:complete